MSKSFMHAAFAFLAVAAIKNAPARAKTTTAQK